MKKITRTLLRWLYLGHRWLGIFACLLFVLWFASGVIMMYVSFPALTDTERMRYLQHTDTTAVRITPDAAMAIAGQAQFPQDLRLQMLLDEPVYRVTGWEGERTTVSAIDGRIVQHIDPEQARALAQRMMSSTPITAFDVIDRDQWSVPQRYDVFRPLYRVAFNDAEHTEIYISSRGGDIVLDTTRTERIWCWLGHVLHWIYFTDLRAEQPLWHHIGGLLGGVFVLTWIVSGWLSMSPNQWLQGAGVSQQEQQRYAGNTWLHIEPHTGQILGKMDATSRADRWLFNALHSMDFHFLIDFRPAWDLVVWTLSLAGLMISVSGVVIGWRRLAKSF